MGKIISHNYDHNIICKFLKYGWPVNFSYEFLPYRIYDNHASAFSYANDVEQYICKELKLQAIVGPFNDRPFHNRLVISPLKTVPKDNNSVGEL